MNVDSNKKTRFIVEAAILAAIYAAITILLAPISYGQIQVRIAEALTILPYFTPAAVPGLFVGCILANIFGGSIIDIVFGSLASLIAAILSRKAPKPWLVPLPPVIINGLVIGWVLYMVEGLPYWLTVGTVTLGQIISCYGLGYPLLIILEKNRDKIFGQHNNK
ncbi:MAG: QueT transporter family protein [Clostridiales bacterium]|nr:QueT transporter family protein [Clostridiales bacterium]